MYLEQIIYATKQVFLYGPNRFFTERNSKMPLTPMIETIICRFILSNLHTSLYCGVARCVCANNLEFTAGGDNGVNKTLKVKEMMPG